MKIIIVGAGEVGRHVAKMLSNENHEILIMDSDEEHLQDLDSNYDMLTHQGSPTSIKDLMLCGVKDCDLFNPGREHKHQFRHIGFTIGSKKNIGSDKQLRIFTSKKQRDIQGIRHRHPRLSGDARRQRDSTIAA